MPNIENKNELGNFKGHDFDTDKCIIGFMKDGKITYFEIDPVTAFSLTMTRDTPEVTVHNQNGWRHFIEPNAFDIDFEISGRCQIRKIPERIEGEAEYREAYTPDKELSEPKNNLLEG